MPKFEKSPPQVASPFETPKKLKIIQKESIEEEASRIIREEFEEVRRKNIKDCEDVSIGNNYESILDEDSPIGGE